MRNQVPLRLEVTVRRRRVMETRRDGHTASTRKLVALPSPLLGPLHPLQLKVQERSMANQKEAEKSGTADINYLLLS